MPPMKICWQRSLKTFRTPIGVVNPLAFVKDKYRGKPIQRHYIKQAEVVHLSGSEAVVSTIAPGTMHLS